MFFMKRDTSVLSHLVKGASAEFSASSARSVAKTMLVPTDEMDANTVKLDLIVKAIRERSSEGGPAAPLQAA